MKRNISNKLFIISCLLVMISCKAKKAIVVGTPPAATAPPVVSAKPVNQMDAVNAAQFIYNTFSAKANAKLVIDGNSNDVILLIHINHDKEIWVSVLASLLNIEVARAVVTPDSINVMDKLHGLYSKKPFSYVYQYANSQVNYKMLEALLVGNAIPEILKDKNANFQTSGTNTTISGTLDDLVYSLMLGTDMKAGQFNLSNHNEGLSLQVTNSALIPAGSKMVPSQIDILSTAKSKKIQINLRYTKVELDQPLVYPFNIPESYKPADEN